MTDKNKQHGMTQWGPSATVRPDVVYMARALPFKYEMYQLSFRFAAVQHP